MADPRAQLLRASQLIRQWSPLMAGPAWRLTAVEAALAIRRPNASNIAINMTMQARGLRLPMSWRPGNSGAGSVPAPSAEALLDDERGHRHSGFTFEGFAIPVHWKLCRQGRAPRANRSVAIQDSGGRQGTPAATMTPQPLRLAGNARGLAQLCLKRLADHRGRDHRRLPRNAQGFCIWSGRYRGPPICFSSVCSGWRSQA